MSRTTKTIILYENEYCHVVNNEIGTIELVEGPRRFTLPVTQSLYADKKKKLVLKEEEYVLLNNPWDPELKRCVLGKKSVLTGPCTRSLYPDESYEGNRIFRSVILNENQGAVVMATDDFEEDGVKRRAGEKYIIKGPNSFIPNKYERYMKLVTAVQVSQNEAIYVRNILTSELKMIEGPKSYLPGVFEELYEKNLSPDEYKSLKLPKKPSSRAFQIQIQKGECVCVIDFKTNEEKYIIGPEGYILGAHEGVKVINTSGRVPKVENVAKLSVVRLGPDFMSDSFNVRTKDNAVVEMLISYKWKFIIDEREKYKIFQGDFVGYSCQSMRSRVRETVSKHEFEKFHTNSSGLLRESLFKPYELEVERNGKKKVEKFSGRFFREFNFLIFQLDVKNIKPVDREIGKLLDESIKSSMRILCNKQQDQAEMESKKNEMINKVEIFKMRENLIKIENENFTKETVEKTKIEGDAKLEKAQAEMKGSLLIQQSRLDLEIENLRKRMEMLKGEAGDAYLEYMRAKKFTEGVESLCVVPGGTKTLFLPAPRENRKKVLEFDDEDLDDDE